MSEASYQTRLVDHSLVELLAEFPAIMIVGPRAAGKTTTARRHATSVVRLDKEGEAAAFRADPDAALAPLPEPVLLDEWQEVPGVLGAVKRAVDDDPRPGRFLLTGSVTAEHDPATWPGVGRLIRLPMYGLTEAEIRGTNGKTPSSLDHLLVGTLDLPPVAEPPDLVGYIDLILRGTFPEPALKTSPERRQRWYHTYVELLVGRDVASTGRSADPGRLRRYLNATAISTAGIVTDASLQKMANIDHKTATAYEDLLVRLHTLDIVPAWSSRRVSRLVKTPKRYVIDPAITAATLRQDRTSILRDGDLLGRLLDTFVAAQIRPQLSLLDHLPQLHHLRDAQGRHEVDLLIEGRAQQIVGVEVKATSGPGREDARHLTWLRDRLGDRFLAGVILHTGPRTYHLDDRILAAPIASLWTATP